MTTFQFNKPIEDVEKPELLPEGWYDVRISQEPAQETNKVSKANGPEAIGAGHNIVLRLRTLHENPKYSGRMLTIWVPMFAVGDDVTYTASGQTKEDWKMENAAEKCTAFGGQPQGQDIYFDEGMLASVYVIQQIAPGRTEPSNSVDINSPVSPITNKGQQIADAMATNAGGPDDDIPF